ncbi:hypothetical protein CRI94_12795 [Longibacter salinarum]|uniref:Uncharacterized protein n=1 Tax=Longibacter salinarum TaxID=1850348 RepID=A0A2A8CVY6_9BACT|nr:hypothetical protein [Longibacter salinarum]PEN12875.1 hypothetical protein CRI94_12795 [Longibacter salinarum]
MNNFWRYLALAFVLFVAALAFIAVRNWDTVSLAWDNATALQEGRQEAANIQTPDALAEYLGNHPEKVSLAVLSASGEVKDTVHATVDRPLHRLPMIALLTDASRMMDEGALDSTEQIPISEIGRFALPGLTASGHERMVDSLSVSGAIHDGAIALGDLFEAIHIFENQAAADWLMMRMGRDAMTSLPDRLSLSGSMAPQPYSATYLTWMQAVRDSSAGKRPPVDSFLGMEARAYRDRVYSIADRLSSDGAYRTEKKEELTTRGTDLSVRQQRDYAMATLPRGTALDYARLMANIRSTPGDGWPRLRSVLERPVGSTDRLTTAAGADTLRPDTMDVAFDAASVRVVADVAGAHPGMLTLAGYARTNADDRARVVVLTLHDLPIAVFYQLAQTGIDKGLFLELLLDEQATQRFMRTVDHGNDESAPTR